MKRNKNIVLFIIINILTISCSKSTVSIIGVPGTIVYDDYNNEIGTINSYGLLHTNSVGSDAFLKAQLPSGRCIPFAIDYKRGSRRKDIALYISGLGFAPWAIPSMVRLSSEEGKYDYKNRRVQYINCGTDECANTFFGKDTDCGINFTTPIFNKYVPEAQPAVEESRHNSESNIKKTLKYFSDQTAGEYVCAGKLERNGKVIESYESIVVKILKVSDNVVAVNVIESNGQSFFNEAEQYDVTKQTDGSYFLTHKKVKDATIRISPAKRIVYFHPQLPIDNEIYQLGLESK